MKFQIHNIKPAPKIILILTSVVMAVTILYISLRSSYEISNAADHNGIAVSATISEPDEIRVGLAYDEPSGALPLKSKISVQSSSGISFYRVDSSNRVKLFDVSDTNDIAIYPGDTAYKHVKPVTASQSKSAAVVDGISTLTLSKAYTISGKYTVLLKHVFSSYAALQSYISGINGYYGYTYPVLNTSGWQLAIGGFANQATAADGMNEILKGNSFLKTGDISASNLSNQSLMGINSSSRIVMCSNVKNAIAAQSKTSGGKITYTGATKKAYRGRMEIVRNAGKNIKVINCLKFEEYLYGVVPAEIGGNAPPEAIKAQAILARTYTLNQVKHKSQGFDVCASVDCQAYGAASIETDNATKNIQATKGEVVTYKGSLAQVFYYSSNGGSTEDVKNVWGSTYPYLIYAKDTSETNDTYHYNWQQTFTPAQVAAALRSNGVDLGNITSITVNKKAASGRPTEITVKGTKDSKTYVNERCRTFLGLPSQLYTIKTTKASGSVKAKGSDGKTSSVSIPGKNAASADGNSKINSSASSYSVIGSNKTKKSISNVPASFVFTGKGWGHAIGLSQNGAMARAKKGQSYKDIISFYFPGTQLTKLK